MQIVADPAKTSYFEIERSKLSANLHSHLTMLKAAPSVATLTSFESHTVNALAASIAKVSMTAYSVAASNVGSLVDLKQKKQLSEDALNRAKVAASLVSTASKLALNIDAGISKMRVASKDRANGISSYELRLAYFVGTTLGWQLSKKAKKIWLLSDAHDTDDSCDENAEEGPISVYEFFSSGHMYCPAHIQCGCTMALIP